MARSVAPEFLDRERPGRVVLAGGYSYNPAPPTALRSVLLCHCRLCTVALRVQRPAELGVARRRVQCFVSSDICAPRVRLVKVLPSYVLPGYIVPGNLVRPLSGCRPFIS